MKLSQMARFLLAWFLFSNGLSTLISICILFAQSSLGVSTAMLLVPPLLISFIAGIFSHLWNVLQTKTGMSTKTGLLIQILIFSLVPLFVLSWLFLPFSIPPEWELNIEAVLIGMVLGSSRSSCRVLYSGMIPRGHEAKFFSLYAIVDKGM